MKNLNFTFFLILLSLDTQAGQFLAKGFYVTQSLVQGFGETHDQAERDALNALPTGYVTDKENNSAYIDCTVSSDLLVATKGEMCDLTIDGNQYLVQIPVKKIN